MTPKVISAAFMALRARLCLGPHSALPATSHMTSGKPAHSWGRKLLIGKIQVIVMLTL